MVVTVSACLRWTAVLVLQAHHHAVDTSHHEHRSIAMNLATGEGFRFNFFGLLEEPVLTSQQAPLVPGLLALSYLVFGVETRASFCFVLAIQVLASSITVAILSRLAHRLTGSLAVGGWTAFLAAVYPPLVVSPLHIQALVWNLFWLAWILLSVVQIRQGDVRLGAAGFVLASLGGLHTDPILAAPIGLSWLLICADALRQRTWSQLRTPVLIAAGLAAGITPWTIRNYVVHGKLVLIKDSLPYVFWQGNNPHSQGTDKLLVYKGDAQLLQQRWLPWEANREAFAVRQKAMSVDSHLESDFIAALQSLPTERQRMELFRQRIRSEFSWANYGRLCLLRLKYLLWFDATNPRSFLWHYRMGYLLLAALALPVMIRGLLRWRQTIAGPCLPLLLAAFGLSLVHVLIITSARFRIPFEMLLVLPAATATYQIALILQSAARTDSLLSYPFSVDFRSILDIACNRIMRLFRQH